MTTRDLRRLRLSEGFFIAAGLPLLDSLVVIPEPTARRVGLGQAVTGARVVTSFSDHDDEPRVSFITTGLPRVGEQLQTALDTNVPEVDVFARPSANVIDDLLAVVLPAHRAITGVYIDPEAILIRFGIASQAQSAEPYERLGVACLWIASLERFRLYQIDAAAQHREVTSITRERWRQEREVAAANAKQLTDALQRAQSKFTKVEDENKRLARRYEALAGSRLGRLTLAYWRIRAKVRKKRVAG